MGPVNLNHGSYAPARDFARQIHETLGLGVLTFVQMRAVWRLVDTQRNPPQGAPWMGVAAKVVHIALYWLLFVVPASAIPGAWLEGHPLTLLAGVEPRLMVAGSHAVGTTIASIHTWLGDAILWVTGLHALASLYHHFVLKYSALSSMLPRSLSSHKTGGG